MAMKQIMANITEFFKENVGPPHRITSVEKREGDEEGWTATVEVFEEREYMKKYAKDEMLGIYHTTLDGDANVVSFKREALRYRSRINENQ